MMMNFSRLCPAFQNYNILNTILPVLINIVPLKIAKPDGRGGRWDGLKKKSLPLYQRKQGFRMGKETGRGDILFFMISKEFCQTNIGKRVFEQTKDRFQRTGNHVGTCFGTLHNMLAASDAGGKYLCFKTLHAVYI